MFGETAVYAFLRISRALATLARRAFNLIAVEFFDDFTQIENVELSSNAQDIMEGSK